MIEYLKFTHSPLLKAFEKQTKRWFYCWYLKKIKKLQNIVKTNELNYNEKNSKKYSFGRYSLPIAFLKDIQEVW